MNTETKQHKKLNLGAGEDYREGYVNVDWQVETHPDVVHDLNVMPYPFADGEFDLIEASHVLEHLDRPFMVMKEFRRILKKGGKLIVKVPHFSRGFTHAEHSHGFDLSFPLYFNPSFTRSGYFGVPFRCDKIEMHWMAFFHLLPSMGFGPVVVNTLRFLSVVISFFANLSPAFASRIWCFWVGGFEEIEFEFIAIDASMKK
jgi:SAM-dependent methyltransferase